ncbi:MAG: hypothetical protein HGA87_03910 [Desulfobulbaceae bacterium]|nr:hypothetical protein [Desulfobulbaceae bacterium]
MIVGAAVNVKAAWKAAADEVTPLSRRRKMLSRFAHGHIAPGGIENMSRQALRERFGAHTVRRYLMNNQRTKSNTYRKDAGQILEKIDGVSKSLDKINQSAQRLQILINDQSGIERKGLSLDLVENVRLYVAAIKEKQTFLDSFDISGLQASVAKARILSAKLLEKSESGDTDLHKAIRGNVRSILRGFDELRLKPLISHEGDKDDLPQSIASILFQHRGLKEEGSVSEESYRLLCVKSFSRLGVFDEDDLLRYLVGGNLFQCGVMREIESIALQKKAKAFKDTNPYGTFKKILPEFIKETLGMTIFAFPCDKPLDQWDEKDVVNLSKFTKSRYVLAHNVILGLTDPKQNPLGEVIRPDQVKPLIHETLRSTLYPDYRLQIRLGFGGTESKEVLVRAAAYVMNALDIMSVFREADQTSKERQGINPPTFLVVSADQLSASINELDPAATRETGRQLLDYLRKFVGEFYPEHLANVRFEQPTREDIFQDKTYSPTYAAAREVVDPARKGGLAVAEALKSVSSFAENHCDVSESKDNRLDRIAHCVTCHLVPSVFATVENNGSSLGPVWKIGGKAENNFSILQQAIRDVVMTSSQTRGSVGTSNAIGENIAGLFTVTSVGGRPPPFYKDSGCKTDVTTDEIVLWQQMQEQGCEREWLKRIKKEKTGVAFDLRAMLTHPRLGAGDIEKGWLRFKSFLLGDYGLHNSPDVQGQEIPSRSLHMGRRSQDPASATCC